MVEVKLTTRSGYKIEPEKALKILKKKLLKENTLREMRDRSFFVSKGRKDYLARTKLKHMFERQRLERAAQKDY